MKTRMWMTACVALLVAAPASAQVVQYESQWPTVGGHPNSIDEAPDGTLWACMSENTVRHYTRDGVLLREVGRGPFATPMGATFLPGGRIAIADYSAALVHVLDAAGDYITAWATAPGQPSISSDAAGRVLYPSVGSGSSGVIHRLDPTTGAETGQFFVLADPTEIVAAGDAIYVGARFNSALQKYSTSGTLLRSFALPRRLGAFGLEVDRYGRIWVSTDQSMSLVSVLDADGRMLQQFGGTGSGAGQFDGPVDLCYSSDDQLYVADYANGRIQRFTAALPVPSKSTTWGRMKSLWR